MGQLVFLGLVEDNGAPLADGVDAPEVGGGIQGGIWGFGDGQLGDGDGQAAPLDAGRLERGIGGAAAVQGGQRFLVVLFIGDGGFGVLAPEEAHGEMEG